MKTGLYLVAALLAAFELAWSCALEFDVAVFSYSHHPDFPRTRYAAGKLGVIEPTYARSYLVVAYRYLAGIGLDAAEQEQVRGYWQDRATGDWDHILTWWSERWEKVRMRVPGAPPNEDDIPAQKYDPEILSWELNCADDAFRVATLTLQTRILQFGLRSAAVKDWLNAQDDVFSNCGSRGNVPVAVPSNMPALLYKDRDYQIAAAHLYRGEPELAANQFRKIADDRHSPWRQMAPYLVARSLLRFNHAQAAVEARKVLADPRNKELHGITTDLLHRAMADTQPDVRLHEVALELLHRDRLGLRQNLWDYTTLLDHFLDNEGKPGMLNTTAVPRNDKLTDWIITFSTMTPKESAHANSAMAKNPIASMAGERLGACLGYRWRHG